MASETVAHASAAQIAPNGTQVGRCGFVPALGKLIEIDPLPDVVGQNNENVQVPRPSLLLLETPLPVPKMGALAPKMGAHGVPAAGKLFFRGDVFGREGKKANVADRGGQLDKAGDVRKKGVRLPLVVRGENPAKGQNLFFAELRGIVLG